MNEARQAHINRRRNDPKYRQRYAAKGILEAIDDGENTEDGILRWVLSYGVAINLTRDEIVGVLHARILDLVHA